MLLNAAPSVHSRCSKMQHSRCSKMQHAGCSKMQQRSYADVPTQGQFTIAAARALNGRQRKHWELQTRRTSCCGAAGRRCLPHFQLSEQGCWLRHQKPQHRVLHFRSTPRVLHPECCILEHRECTEGAAFESTRGAAF